MNTTRVDRNSSFCYELRFTALVRAGRGYAFPCDAEGRVDIDSLSEVGRRNYFYARAVIGRELSWPETRRVRADAHTGNCQD